MADSVSTPATSLGRLCRDTASRLAPRYGRTEAEWMVRIIMEELKGYSRVDLAVKSGMEVSGYFAGKVNSVTDRLLAGEPIQYIFGKASFYGMKLNVSPEVLIPRPETEELVDIIVNGNKDRSDLRVLDVCTGSGCIAIALARNLPFSKVTAIDISSGALDIARKNAAETKTAITFVQDDALSLKAGPSPEFDIIVSNPPYVLDSEKSGMDANVIEHEPDMALFVPDNDPLRFYLPIARYAMDELAAGGRLYFELNPLSADGLASILKNDGWLDVEVIIDSFRKRRFLSAIRP